MVRLVLEFPLLLSRRLSYDDSQDYAASFADEVFKLDGNGCLQTDYQYTKPECNIDDEQQWSADCQSTTVGQAEKATRYVATTASSGPGNTRVSDTQVYRLYLTSIGVWFFALFVICGMFFAVTMKFPSKRRVITSRNPWLTGVADIWATWWVDSLTKQSASRSISLWMALYALLGCLPPIVLAVWLRCVVSQDLPLTSTNNCEKAS